MKRMKEKSIKRREGLGGKRIEKGRKRRNE